VGSFLSWLDHLREEPTSVSFYTDRETRPRHDLTRFTFLLGADNGDQLFNLNQ